MEQTIPALLVAAIMIVSGVLLADVTNDSVSNVNESWREIETISEDRLGTDLAVLSTQVNLGGSEIVAIVLNEGRTPIDDFELMDVIVSYDGLDLERHSVWLPYNEDAVQPDNTWQITAFTNDFRNPGILDTGEEMTIRIRLDPATDVGPDRWFVLSTEAGVAYTVYF